MRKRLIILSTLLFASFADTLAQCAMCKTTIVNNVSNGDLSLAEGLNYGILYLFIAPYLGIVIVGYFWYRYSRAHKKLSNASSIPVN